MLFRLAALAAFSLAIPAYAQTPDAADVMDAPLPEMPVMPGDMMPAPMMNMPMGPPPGVRKITDGALSCEQIYAESRSLEAEVAKYSAESDAAMQEANAAQQAMMSNAGSGVGTQAVGLLGMVPGASMFTGMAQQAAMSAQMSALQESQSKMMTSYQRMAKVQERMAYAQARNDHLVGLFLEKKCKLPEGAKP